MKFREGDEFLMRFLLTRIAGSFARTIKRLKYKPQDCRMQSTWSITSRYE